ncbi:MAG: c-type cytochrome [Vicinamibacterales bacterium]
MVLLLVALCAGCGPRQEQDGQGGQGDPATAAPAPAAANASPASAYAALKGLPRNYELVGPLVPAHTTMVSAWDVPADPLADETLAGTAEGALVRRGYEIFTHTAKEAPGIASGTVSCSNCHLNAGQRERALPLVGVSAAYPEMNRRAERMFTIEDRIIECFMRSENGTQVTQAFPAPDSTEVQAVKAYLDWLSRGYDKEQPLPWRGKNAIAADKLIPLDRLDPARGEALFLEKCINCHGRDGQGVWIGDKKAAPLWGPDSWNDGAGAARVYTLAGIIRYAMPYLEPGSLTDDEAQHLAAFITSKPRPSYPFKDRDYVKAGPPKDAVYYPSRR